MNAPSGHKAKQTIQISSLLAGLVGNCGSEGQRRPLTSRNASKSFTKLLPKPVGSREKAIHAFLWSYFDAETSTAGSTSKPWS